MPLDVTKTYPHGTRARYVLNRCRCERCTEANRVYGRTVDRENKWNPRTVPTPLIRKKIRKLLREGASIKAIAKTTGLNRKTISNILNGEVRFVHRDRARLILGLSNSDVVPTARCVPSGPTLKAIDKLLGMGWSKVGIARVVISPTAKALQIRGEQVLATTEAKVLALLEENKNSVPTQTGTLVCDECGQPLMSHSIAVPCRDLRGV